MYLFSFLALAGIALARPCDEHSSASVAGYGNHWQPWSPSSASAPAQGDHQATSTAQNGHHAASTSQGDHYATSTATKGWNPPGAHSHYSAASSASVQTWSLPKADPSAKVLPLHKRPNPSSLSFYTPTGWGDWTYSSSATNSASGSKSTTSSATSTTAASTSASSKTSSLTSTTKGSSSTSKTSSKSSSVTTSSTSSEATSTTLSTLTTSTSTGSTSSSSSVSSKTSSSSSASVSSSSTTSSSSSSSSTVSSTTSSSTQPIATLLNPEINTLFTLEVTIGDTAYDLLVDTGSSDTWAAANAAPAGFTPIPNEYLYIAYAGGTYALGPLGNDSVTLAGLTVPEQTVSIVDQTTATGPDNVGLIGLSFNNLTSAFSGQEPAAADRPLPYPGGDIKYSSIMNTIFNVDNLTPDLFSLALSRDPDGVPNTDQYGGVFVIGGQPDLTDPTINVTTPVVNTPMVNFNQNYTIAVDSVTFGNQVLDQGVQYLVDSGTTLLYAPDASVSAYWSQFNPLPNVNGTVDCNTPIPPFGVTISGETFFVNPADILRPNGDGTCNIGIQPRGGLPANILGDVFLMNVLAVFDWGAEQIGFGGREYYSVPA